MNFNRIKRCHSETSLVGLLFPMKNYWEFSEYFLVSYRNRKDFAEKEYWLYFFSQQDLSEDCFLSTILQKQTKKNRCKIGNELNAFCKDATSLSKSQWFFLQVLHIIEAWMNFLRQKDWYSSYTPPRLSERNPFSISLIITQCREKGKQTCTFYIYDVYIQRKEYLKQGIL